ncbi:MAG: hypothetical protein A4E53_02145 [Pelotomaculum sp. PtaB.Bin104]|nr:MAG: hypothetical protein A4E53_02145 [Pelotomaculum sp. PtaB.Bin104]
MSSGEKSGDIEVKFLSFDYIVTEEDTNTPIEVALELGEL